MQLQNISVKSDNLLQLANQKVSQTPTATQPQPPDSLQLTSKKKEIIKYSTIGAGVLAAIITAINYKKIGNAVSKKIKNCNNIPAENHLAKKDLLPANKLLNTFGKPFVDSENYKLWHFTSDEFLEKFIKAHDDIYSEYKKTKLDEHGLWSLKVIRDYSNKGKDEFINFVSKVEDKIGVDLSQEVKHYRFIGKSEFDILRAKMPIENNKHGQIYVSLCPEPKYDVPGRWDYRVTFKNTNNITENMGGYHNYSYKSTIHGSYSASDIEDVEKLVNGQWQKVNLDNSEESRSRMLVKVDVKRKL